MPRPVDFRLTSTSCSAKGLQSCFREFPDMALVELKDYTKWVAFGDREGSICTRSGGRLAGRPLGTIISFCLCKSQQG